jgi:rhamnulose-1-phosphate aldolase
MNRLLESGKILKIKEEFRVTARLLWEKGWAERNAGNISANITREFAGTDFPEEQSIPMQQDYPALSGELFLFTTTGSRMREMAVNPDESLCLVLVNEQGKGFLQSYADHPVTPTSELPTHLSIHEMLLREKPGCKAIVHTHCTELIALTHIRNYCSTPSINRLLWSMHPETLLFAPKGIGFIPFTIPGTTTIAKATVEMLRHHDIVVWEKHGVMAIGATVSEAFDLIDLMAKSARIFFTCRDAGYYPEGLSDRQLAEIKKTIS